MPNQLATYVQAKRQKLQAMIQSIRDECQRYRQAVDVARAFLKPREVSTAFEPLTPVLLDEVHSRRYERELLNALTHDQIRNVAITGEYGAGKSSLIRTFVKNHTRFKYAYVSLATFGKEAKQAEAVAAKPSHGISGDASPGDASAAVAETAGGEAQTETDLVARIEETIVQQLLYSVPARRLPRSRLKRIIQPSWSRVWQNLVVLIVVILAALREYVPAAEKPIKVDPASWLQMFLGIPGSVAICVLALGGAYFLYHALRLSSLFSIDGLMLKGGKLESTHHGSVLHKNVDEIIYCFERSKIDVVVIEDLDRFGLHDVFTRLREINFIIRRSITRPVYFIYALRDEMFAVGEKTKFFDLIIPVIPVINSENSREKMAELLEARGLKAGLAGKLIEAVCYDINDMRLVKNMVNEYDMFSSILVRNLAGLNANKQFAIVAIRNLYPEAYADLVKRRGAIHGVIAGFPEWKRAQARDAQEKLNELRVFKEEKIKDVALDAIELRTYVWFALMRKLGRESATHVLDPDGNKYTIGQFVSDEVFQELVSRDADLEMVEDDRRNFGFRQSGVAIGALLMEFSYNKRFKHLQTPLSTIDADIQKQQKHINALNRLTFKAAAKGEYAEVIRDSLHEFGLVTYLMRAGYFDTDYADYLGYFYPGSLSVDDKRFLVALRDDVTPDVNTRITDPGHVLDKLDSDGLSNGKGIVADLIAHLCGVPYGNGAPDGDDAKLAFILLDGVNGHLDRLAVATESLLSRPDVHRFILAVYTLQPDAFLALLKDAEVFQEADARQRLVCAVLDNLDESQASILAADEHTDIYRELAGLQDVSRVIPNLDSGAGGWTWLRQRPLRFNRLGDALLLEDLRILVKQGYIEVNLTTLSLICRMTGQPEKGKPSPTVTYSHLASIDMEGLDDLLLRAPVEFVEVLLGQVGQLPESEKPLSQLLGAVASNPAVAQKLFERTTCSIARLGDLPKTLWGAALRSDRLYLKAQAVWDVFDSKILDSDELATAVLVDGLIDFIRLNAQLLKVELWQLNSRPEGLQRFLINLPGLDDHQVQLLLGGVWINDPSVLPPTLATSRWEMLVNLHTLEFSREMYSAVSAQAPRFEALFLQKRWSKARESINFAELPIGVVLQLSKSGVPHVEDRVAMWSCTTSAECESTEGAYEELGAVCAAANRASIQFPASVAPTLESVALMASLRPDVRAEVIIQILQYIEWRTAVQALDLLHEDGFSGIWADGREIEVSFSDVNFRLMQAIEAKGMVHSVSQTGAKIQATTPSLRGGADLESFGIDGGEVTP